METKWGSYLNLNTKGSLAQNKEKLHKQGKFTVGFSVSSGFISLLRDFGFPILVENRHLPEADYIFLGLVIKSSRNIMNIILNISGQNNIQIK